MKQTPWKKRKLRFEALEERTLLAVWSGAAIAAAGAAEPMPTAAPVPAGQKAGDVYVKSTYDIDGDGFIGPGDNALLSGSWFAPADGGEGWTPACDLDGDGFVGPGDYALVSAYWFRGCDELPDGTKSYEIYPDDPSNWTLSGSDTSNIGAADGVLTFDARKGSLEAVCAYGEFGGSIRVSADFTPTRRNAGISAGIELAVQDSGECYYAAFQSSRAVLYYVGSGGQMTELASDAVSLEYLKTYGIWAQTADGQIACGIGENTLISVYDARLSGGKLGFRAVSGVETFTNIQVERDPEPTEATPAHRYVTVTRGQGSFGYAAFPDVCRLNDGRLMAVFYAGYGHVSHPSADYPKGGRICAVYSYDDGRSWTVPQIVADTGYDDRDPSVVQLEDGRILCNFFALTPDGVSGERLVTKLTESADGGLTWSAPVTVYEGYAVSSPIRVLSNGTLLMPLYRQANNTAWGAAGLSYDQGVTWEKPVTIPRNGFRLDAETDIIQRNDGTLYAVQRYEMAYSVSADYGKTWSPSRSIGFHGQCPYLYRAPNGVVVMALREELSATQTTIRVSLDDCKTWSKPVVVDNVPGAYASIAGRRDGSLLILYYEEGSGSNIRARCFTVDDSGNVEWKLL